MAVTHLRTTLKQNTHTIAGIRRQHPSRARGDQRRGQPRPSTERGTRPGIGGCAASSGRLDPKAAGCERGGSCPRGGWWVIGLLGLHGPDTASEANNKQSLPSPITPPERLVDSPPYVAGTTYSQTVNSQAGARTYANPYGMAGEGERIPNHMAVHVSCKIIAPGASSVGTYWYRIADPPWKDYYSPTNSFLNDDPINGSHKKPVDEKVPYCPT